MVGQNLQRSQARAGDRRSGVLRIRSLPCRKDYRELTALLVPSHSPVEDSEVHEAASCPDNAEGVFVMATASMLGPGRKAEVSG